MCKANDLPAVLYTNLYLSFMFVNTIIPKRYKWNNLVNKKHFISTRKKPCYQIVPERKLRFTTITTYLLITPILWHLVLRDLGLPPSEVFLYASLGMGVGGQKKMIAYKELALSDLLSPLGKEKDWSLRQLLLSISPAIISVWKVL